jgi:hypothetical protein
MATFSEVALIADTMNAWEGKVDISWYNTTDTSFTIANADQLAGLNKIVSGAEGYTKDSFERLLVIGISVKMAVQALLNVAVVTNTIPNTGISLPFFSYGGSSLIMLFFEMGIVLSVSRTAKISK